MTYNIVFSESCRRQFRKLNKELQRKIVNYLETRVCINPILFGKSLSGNKKGLWRYRVGDYRIICNIDNNELIVLVIEIGHRSDIYDN